MCINGTYYTSPDSKNLLMNIINIDEYKKNVEKEMKAKPFSEFCPEDQPFSIGNHCQNCPDGLPYLNLDSNECENCQSGRSYD